MTLDQKWQGIIRSVFVNEQCSLTAAAEQQSAAVTNKQAGSGLVYLNIKHAAIGC